MEQLYHLLPDQQGILRQCLLHLCLLQTISQLQGKGQEESSTLCFLKIYRKISQDRALLQLKFQAGS